jgi:hydrogenase maturation protein HypF
MADNALTGEVIGLTWDGTGLGTDGTIWGGECLIGGFETFRRFGSVLPIPLIGGDRAVKEIDRVAFALRHISSLQNDDENAALYESMLASGVNCPLSSGMGRLFDGAAALLGIKKSAGYEGQGAVLLEAAADEAEDGCFPIEWLEENNTLFFDWRAMVAAMEQRAGAGESTAVLSACFMNTLVRMAEQQCRRARECSGLNRVVLSGGSFQNLYLMKRLPYLLREDGFEVYHHKRVSCNDEGLSLGQAAIALHRLGKETNVFGSTT